MSNLGLAITSLFSGVGALDYGLELSGLGCITSQVEIDSYCQNVLERHFPAAEVFCGGFPCQGVSRAGSGRGLDAVVPALGYILGMSIKRIIEVNSAQMPDEAASFTN